jgi:hypothetical protein
VSGTAILGVGNRVEASVAAGEINRLYISVDGLANMIDDLRARGLQPVSIALSKRDRRDLNDDLMSLSKAEISKADAADNQMHIGMIKGVMIGWNRHVQNGKCAVNLKPAQQ